MTMRTLLDNIRWEKRSPPALPIRRWDYGWLYRRLFSSWGWGRERNLGKNNDVAITRIAKLLTRDPFDICIRLGIFDNAKKLLILGGELRDFSNQTSPARLQLRTLYDLAAKIEHQREGQHGQDECDAMDAIPPNWGTRPRQTVYA